MIQKWRVPNGAATHLLMDGGMLNVPPEETEEFYRAYIQAVKSGTKMYVVEQKTERFKFFVDLDYKAPEKLSDTDLVEFCNIIHEATGTKSRCLIAKAQPRPVKEGIKSGVHIHWPDLVVNRTEALNLRTKIITSLGEGPWDTIIDASVYGGSGLRMLWSHKKPSGDPYIPWRDLVSGRDFPKEPDEATLALFAIRTDEVGRLAHETVEIEGLEEFIQRYLMGQRRAQVKKVQRHEHDGWYAQSDSKFCERIRTEHKSNHIWFSIHSGRVSQRCFDEECREFHGQEHILPPSIVEQLKDVAIVGSPSSSFLMDIFPNGPQGAFQKVRKHGPSLLGSGPRKLESFFGKPASI